MMQFSLFDRLECLSLVSRKWCAHARHVFAKEALGYVQFVLENTVTRVGVLHRREQVILRRVVTKDLTATSGSVNPCRTEMTGQWGVILSHVALLEALDLHGMSLQVGCGDVVTIVDATVKHCPLVTSLKVPSVTLYSTAASLGRRNLKPLFNAMRRGMQRWQTSRSRHGYGLRELSMPDLPMGNARAAYATQYLEDILRYCPRVEALGNLDLPGREHNTRLVCHGQWFVSEELWERFCQTCVNLTSFDWVTVPYTTRFFQIFGKYEKPRLTDMVLATPMNWDWKRYHEEMKTAGKLNRCGCGAISTCVEEVLFARPALKELKVLVYHPHRGRETRDPQDYLCVPKEKMMKQEQFGDRFCHVLASWCPRLEAFGIFDVLEDPRNTPPVMRFTDDALTALATLPYLIDIRLNVVNITGVGLYELINNSQRESSAQREYDIAVGSDVGDGSTELAFYEIVKAFLEQLDNEEAPLRCAQRRVVLCLKNGKRSIVAHAWESHMYHVCGV